MSGAIAPVPSFRPYPLRQVLSALLCAALVCAHVPPAFAAKFSKITALRSAQGKVAPPDTQPASVRARLYDPASLPGKSSSRNKIDGLRQKRAADHTATHATTPVLPADVASLLPCDAPVPRTSLCASEPASSPPRPYRSRAPPP